MNAEFHFYINHIEVFPANSGELSIDIKLKENKGGRYYEKELSGDIKLFVEDYKKVNLVNYFEAVPFEIIERLNGVDTVVFIGIVMRSQGEGEQPFRQQISLKVKPKGATAVFLDKAEQTLNLMEVAPIVNNTYRLNSSFEYKTVLYGPTDPNPSAEISLPYWGKPIKYASGDNILPYFLIYVREIVTVYNLAGEPQKPEGEGWQQYFNNKDNNNVSTWFRTPTLLNPATDGVDYFYQKFVAASSTFPPLPDGNGQQWLLIDELSVNPAPPLTPTKYRVYVDEALIGGEQALNNGRYLFDVLQYAVKKTHEDLSFYSTFLTADLNPVTLRSNECKGLVLHSSKDVKEASDDAAFFSRKQKYTALNLLEQLCNRFNLYWYVDEMAWQVVLEHTSYSNPSNVLDIGDFYKEYPDVVYVNKEYPIYEEYETLANNIDFSATPIEHFCNVSSGITSIDVTGLLTDINSIFISKENYSNETLVLVQPKALIKSGELSEKGAITGYFMPNVALSQSNLNEKYAAYWRRTKHIRLNFKNFEATVAPFIEPPPIIINNIPLSRILGYKRIRCKHFDTLGVIVSMSFNLGSQTTEIKAKF